MLIIRVKRGGGKSGKRDICFLLGRFLQRSSLLFAWNEASSRRKNKRESKVVVNMRDARCARVAPSVPRDRHLHKAQDVRNRPWCSLLAAWMPYRLPLRWNLSIYKFNHPLNIPHIVNSTGFALWLVIFNLLILA